MREEILKKFLSNKCSYKECESIVRYLEKHEEELDKIQLFEDLPQNDLTITSPEIKQAILHSILPVKRKIITLKHLLVAAIVLLAATFPFYKIGTFGKKPDAFISLEKFENYKTRFSFPKKGDILISVSGTIGRLVVYNGKPAYFQDSNIIWLGHEEDVIKNTFLLYVYEKLKWQTSDGGIISRLYNSDFKKMKIKFPENPVEQQKIATFLSSVDELIVAQHEKIEALREHKKGLIQGLFPKIES